MHLHFVFCPFSQLWETINSLRNRASTTSLLRLSAKEFLWQQVNFKLRYVSLGFLIILFVFTDERWKKNRRLLNPAFHFQILNPFVDAINNKGINCIEKFEEALENHKGGEMDVFPIIISRSTLDIICGNYLSSV